MTDNNKNKYREWCVTIFTPENKPLDNSVLDTVLKDYCERYAFQLELSENDKYHFQVALKTQFRKRQSTVVNDLAKGLSIPATLITVNKMNGSWEENLKYVTKNETRAEGAEPLLSEGTIAPYAGEDLIPLEDPSTRYPWQNKLFAQFFKDSPTNILPREDRKVYWVTDVAGCTGKSLFVKWLCYKNPNVKKLTFGTSHQLRSGIIDAGPALMYVVDIPRTKGVEDHLNNIITVIEDLKSGFVVSNFHGKSRTLMINPPHVLIFSNMPCPVDKLSLDRWEMREIMGKEIYVPR